MEHSVNIFRKGHYIEVIITDMNFQKKSTHENLEDKMKDTSFHVPIKANRVCKGCFLKENN